MSALHSRPAFIAGLRALAELLEARPDVQIPRSTVVHHFVPDAQDADMPMTADTTPLIHYRCCTCNGTGLYDDQTCADCHGTGIDNHGA
ncbi:hypothetical protein ACWCOT_20265 [Nonomuraea bangladeshensis]